MRMKVLGRSYPVMSQALLSDPDRRLRTARHHVDVVCLDDEPSVRVALLTNDDFAKLRIVMC